jgi:outer membrane protein OmpA-like peptidoglycan-associated protein
MVMKRILLFLFLLASTWMVVAQDQLSTKSDKARRLFINAYRNYQDRQDETAMELALLAIKEDNKFVEAYLLIAELYNEKKDYQNEIWAYKSVIKVVNKVNPKVYLLLGDAERMGGKPADAIIHYKLVLAEPGLTEKYGEELDNKIKQCEFAIVAMKNPVPFKLLNLGPMINSKFSEYWPGMTVDESELILTVLLPDEKLDMFGRPHYQEDFYVSRKKGADWDARVDLGLPMNTPNNEGAQSISADGQTLVFTACNRPEGMGNCDLYISKKIGNSWTVPQNMGSPINTVSKETQPSLSADGKTLFFASDRRSSKGGLDIWRTEQNEDETWQIPVNLGDTINTKKDDQAPFFHSDNQTLYFSSAGHPGLGGLDLYMTKLYKDNKWSIPHNLGYPLNTMGDEVSLHVNARGTYGLISSEREEGYGKLDIYKFELFDKIRPKPVTYMKGIVYDAETGQKLEAKFELIDLQTQKTVARSESNPLTGEFLVCLPVHNLFALNVSKPGYLFYSENFSLNNPGDSLKTFIKDIPLQPIKIGKTMVLNNIFFDFDKFSLKPESFAELNKLLVFLQFNPGLKIEIGGHTDNAGSVNHNQVLSNNRAKAVYDFLVQQKIKPERLSFHGYGASVPLSTNSTEEGKAQNRRTEIKIVQ